MARRKDVTDQTPPSPYQSPGQMPELYGVPLDQVDDRDYLEALFREQELAKKLDQTFWYNEAVLMAGVIIPLVRKTFFCSAFSHAEWMASKFEIDIDMTLVNKAALDWLASYGFDLVSRISKTQQILTREAITQWVKDGDPLSSLIDYLTPIYGKTRAQMIATTEVTRAYAEGNITVWKTSGVVSGKEWHTAEDDLVCPICAPLDGMQEKLDGGTFDAIGGFGGIGGPPAHVRCRCWLVPIVDEPKLALAQLERKTRLQRMAEAVELRDGN